MKRMDVVSGPGNTRRLRTLKRRKEEKKEDNKVKLERVLGLTVPSNAGLACSPATGIIAYPAGCTVVLYNPRKNRQAHITNISRKTITSIGFSEDGRYIVTGEYGHLPSVRIWDVHDKSLIAEFTGHKYGINCVAFAPNNKYVVSVGSQHDMIVNVWDWRNNIKVASNKISTKVKAISFSENGNYFVTTGNRHVKFWYLEYSRSKYNDPMPLMGRSAILGEQRNNYFCDVSCGRGEMGDSTYAITKSGLLCEFNNRRLLDKWVELRTQTANCLSVGEDFIFIGCGDGIVRCFSPHTLQFITTLPRTHYLGVDVSKGLSISHMASHPSHARYPDAKAVTYDEQNFKVTVVYNDHSIYIWDVRDIKKVGKNHSFIFHSACIWGLEIYPPFNESSSSQKPVLPPGSFITCSSDDTIRIWNLSVNMPNNTLYRRNIYSDDLLKTLYIDSELSHIKELDTSNTDKSSGNGGNNETVVDQRNGVRCIRISPDGKHLASGDRAGNIRVHELQFMDELCKIEAHDAEVLCLEYCGPTRASKGKQLLVSASRDRLIHIFNASRDYSFLTTLDDHSSSITAVRFLPTPQPQMVSCGADKSIIFRDINVDKRGFPEFSRGTHVVGKTTLYDMEVDHNTKHILTACQDRNIRVYTVGNGKHSKTFKGSVSDDGTLIKVALDRSGIYAATSCTDKTLAIYDYYTGECMATMFGHSELVTGLKFTNDCKHLISVSGDGCIFIWRLPHEMTATMLARLQTSTAAASVTATLAIGTRSPSPNKNRVYIGGGGSEEKFGPPPPEFLKPASPAPENDSYRFSVGKLPVWAKKQIADGKIQTPSSPSPLTAPRSPQNQCQKAVDFPKGRWGQRVGSQGMTVKSHYDSDSVILFPTPPASTSTTDNSKESSLGNRKQPDYDDENYDSNSIPENENHRGISPLRRGNFKHRDALPLHLRNSSRNNHTDESSLGSNNTEHDADIDEFSDGLTTQDDGGESTEPEHTERIMYFGQSEEAPNAYTVNAMDVDELRRSQRRHKKSKPERPNDTTTSPSQESDLDDDLMDEDEVSTPSAENSDRNILSMISAVSSENVDLVGRRERFLKSNFESLSGNGNEALDVITQNNTISNQFREGTSAVQRNAVTIARAQSFRDREQNKKREELQRRIEETRKKLQNIGYRSMLRGSQSISDLSVHIPEKDPPPSGRLSQQSLGGGGGSSGVDDRSRRDQNNASGTSSSGSAVVDDQDSSGLRRTCSLSDLNKPSTPRRILPSPPSNVSGKKSSSDHRQSSSNNNRPVQLHGPPVLLDRPIMNSRKQQSRMVDSHSPVEEDLPSYMRSTSASTKKSAPQHQQQQQQLQQHQHQSATLPRQRTSIGQMTAQSTSDLRRNKSEHQSQQPNEIDSSSEENSERKSSSGRRRSSSQDRRPSARNGNSPHRRSNTNLRDVPTRSERDLTKVTKVRVRTTNTKEDTTTTYYKQRSKMKTTTLIVSDPVVARPPELEQSPDDHPVRDGQQQLQQQQQQQLDVLRAPLNRQLAERMALALQQASDNLVQLYKRISLDYDLEENVRTDMLQKLSATAGVAQQTLRPVNPGIAHGELASAAMASINQILSKQGVQPSQNSGSTTTAATTTGGSSSSSSPAHPSDLQNNPYFLHMIENYSNMMYQNMAAQQRATNNNSSNAGGGGGGSGISDNQKTTQHLSDHSSSNQGPSWC